MRPYQQRLATRLFDRRIESGRPITVHELGASNPDQIDYVASGWFFLRRGLHGWDVSPDDVFVDFGSGKGRIVYQAARFRFGRVEGIEMYAELTRIAQSNIDRNRRQLACANVELLTADITSVRVPDDMTVAYIYNPVRGESFRRLLENIVASLDRRPRRVRLIYANPTEAAVIESTGRFQLVIRSRGLRPDLPPSLYVYEAAGPDVRHRARAHGPVRRSGP